MYPSTHLLLFITASLTQIDTPSPAVAQPPASRPTAAAEPLSLIPASAPAASEPASRAFPSPFESPFPYSDFLGPTIGTPDTTPDWPIQKALKDTPLGRFASQN